MKIQELNKLKNKEYLVLFPSFDYDIEENVKYSFNNVINVRINDKVENELENLFKINSSINYLNSEDIKELIQFINDNCKIVVLFDYSGVYRKVLPYISKKIKIKWVYRYSLSCMTNGLPRLTFHMINEFYDRDIVNEIICLDEDTYKIVNNSGYNSSYIKLDSKVKKRNSKKSNSIGILSFDSEPNHNFYNQLSAINLVEYSKVKLISTMPATDHFIRFFNINAQICKDINKVMKDNFVNLYINFTFNNINMVLKSMDAGIPCIVGNTDLFDNYPLLKKYLVVDSDDDIEEISQKIKNIKDNTKEILNEYQKFRKKYSQTSKKDILKVVK